jgi:hypothetical protein
MLGLKDVNGQPHKKGTMILTDVPEVASLLDQARCDRTHQHSIVIGHAGITARTGHYPKPLCSKMVDGVEACWTREHHGNKTQEAFAARVTLTQGTHDHESCPGEHEAAADEEDVDDLEGGDPSDDDGFPSQEGPSPGTSAAPQINKELDVSKELMSSIRRMHENSGHKPLTHLARALMICGAPAEAIEASKRLKCDVCLEVGKTKTHRPATLPRARAFGDRVHTDLIDVYDCVDTKHWALNIVDAASGFQVVVFLEKTDTESIIEAFERTWCIWAGSPALIIADMGPQFTSDEFSTWCEAVGSTLYHIVVEAPWQNGIAERNGGAFKAIARAVVKQHGAQTCRHADCGSHCE